MDSAVPCLFPTHPSKGVTHACIQETFFTSRSRQKKSVVLTFHFSQLFEHSPSGKNELRRKHAISPVAPVRLMKQCFRSPTNFFQRLAVYTVRYETSYLGGGYYVYGGVLRGARFLLHSSVDCTPLVHK